MCQQALLHYLCTRMGVAAGILPAVEPGFQPGGKTLDNTETTEFPKRATSSSAGPGGRMPHSTSGRMPDATITQADLALFLRLAERFTDFQAKETKKHADKRLPESISRNAQRLDELLATIIWPSVPARLPSA